MDSSVVGLSVIAARARELLAQGATLPSVGALLEAVGADLASVLDELADAGMIHRSAQGWACAPVPDADVEDGVTPAGGFALRRAAEQLEEATARLAASHRAGARESRIAYGRHGIFRELCRTGALTETVRMMSPAFPASIPVLSTGREGEPHLRSQVELTAAANVDDPRMGSLLQMLDDQEIGNVSVLAAVPAMLVIQDESLAYLSLDPNGGNTALIVTGRAACRPLVALFDQLATTARPLRAWRQPLSLSELAVLRLLAEGATDDAVARRLGISDRTVRRVTAALQVKLGVRSRLQLGASAARRGLI